MTDDNTLKEKVTDLYRAGAKDIEIAGELNLTLIEFNELIGSFMEADPKFTDRMNASRHSLNARSRKVIMDKVDEGDIDAAKYHLDRRTEDYNPKSTVDLNVNDPHELTEEEKQRLKAVLG